MYDIIHRTDHGLKPAILVVLALMTASLAIGQTPSTSAGATAAAPSEWTARSPQELAELVGPIALYPDDLVAIVLPAATYPLQVVQASRYLEDRANDASLEADPEWDDSVVALLNYPEALALLNDDLDWTWELGEAVVYQQGDVLNAIQDFRDRAQASGNLRTDDRQVVATQDDGAITIAPADPEVIYVPYYDPARVVVRQYVPAYSYYPYAYPVYYYPYPSGYTFGSGFFWGVTTAFLVSWPDHYLHVYHPSHYGHPYYGYSYYRPWYSRTNVYVNVNHYGNGYYWRPGYRHGGRPQHHATFATRYDDGYRQARAGRIGDWRGDSTRNTGDRNVGRIPSGDAPRSTRDRRVTGPGGDANRSGNSGRITGPGGASRMFDPRAQRGASGDVRARAARPSEPSLADDYRRPRTVSGRVTRDVDARSVGGGAAQSPQSRGRISGPGAARSVQDGGRIARGLGGANEQVRTQSRSLGAAAHSGRLEPNRGAPAAQMRAAPSTFARVAPTQPTPAASPRTQSREQPTTWRGTDQRAAPAPAAQAPRGASPMARAAGGDRSGGRPVVGDRSQRRR